MENITSGDRLNPHLKLFKTNMCELEMIAGKILIILGVVFIYFLIMVEIHIKYNLGPSFIFLTLSVPLILCGIYLINS